MGGETDTTHRSLTPIHNMLIKQTEKEKLITLLDEKNAVYREGKIKAVRKRFAHYFSYFCQTKYHLLNNDIAALTEAQAYSMHERIARNMRIWLTASLLFCCVPILGQAFLIVFSILPPLSWKYEWTVLRLKIQHGSKCLPMDDIRAFISSHPYIPRP